MVKELQTQSQDEIAHRDWCISELDSNKKSTEAAYYKKDSLTAQIADLKKRIEQLTKDIDASKKAIADAMDQMKRASETREAENADFQVTVNNHPWKGVGSHETSVCFALAAGLEARSSSHSNLR